MIIARNLMKTPRWPSKVTSADGWAAFDGNLKNLDGANVDTRDGADPITGGAGYRLTSAMTNAGTMFAYLPASVSVAPGARIRVGLHYTKTKGDHMFGLRPEIGTPFGSASLKVAAVTRSEVKLKDGSADADLSALTVALPDQAGYEWIEHVFTLPDISALEYTDRYGDPVGPVGDQTGYRWALCIWCATTGLQWAGLSGCRVDTDDYAEPLTGYVDGSMSAEGRTFAWAGEPFASETTVTALDPDPGDPDPGHPDPGDPDPGDPDPGDPDPGDPDPGDPDPGDPDPEDGVISIIPQQVIDRGGQRVADTLGWTEDRLDEARAAYETTLLIAWAYTRGVGFTDDLVPAYPISRAAELAACRLAPNPEQLTRWQLGSDSETMPGFTGFTLAERHVLDRYRVRWA